MIRSHQNIKIVYNIGERISMVIKKKFSELEYVYPDFEGVQKKIQVYAAQIKDAKNYKDYKQAIFAYDQLSQALDFEMTIPFIRMYLDCTDTYYQEEVGKVQAGGIMLDQTVINQAILESPFVDAFKEELGEEFVALINKDNKIKGKGKEIQVKLENLVNQYQQMKASLKITFDGEVYSEAQLNKFNEHLDRDVRKRAKIAYYEALLTQKAEWIQILEQMVDLRIELAKANGYENYLDYINEEKGRRGYGEVELNGFSEQVKEEIVPLLRKLLSAQAKRIGVEHLNIYDQALVFVDGNEEHIGEEGILEAARKMYYGLSEKAGRFYDEMIERELIDIKGSPNKISNMGFCTLLSQLKVPYVFGNCNQTPFDVCILTHEVGHAYQGYLAMHKQPLALYYNQENDIAEIPSKTMEQFSYEYAGDFFGATKDKYLFHHQQQIIDEICAYTASNAFENYLYTYPTATMAQRIEAFNNILIEYAQIEEDDELKPYFDEGCLLFRHMGIYMFPKYLISYAVSAMSACEFRTKMDQDPVQAWEDYERFCEAGGSLSYRELLALANLTVPFEAGAVKKCTKSLSTSIQRYLEK